MKRVSDYKAHELAQMLEGVKRTSTGYVSICPAHDDKNPSFLFRDKPSGLQYRCEAGCHARDIQEAINNHGCAGYVKRQGIKKEPLKPQDTSKIKYSILSNCVPLQGTLGHKYLLNRGVDKLPKDHGILYNSYKDSHSIVVKLSDGSIFCKYFDKNTLKKKGYGAFGRNQDNACELIETQEPPFYGFGDGDELLITEGLEDALTAYQITPNRDKYTFISLGSSENMKRFTSFSGFKAVTVIADNDKAGLQGALALKANAAPLSCKIFTTSKDSTDLNDTLKDKKIKVMEVNHG